MDFGELQDPTVISQSLPAPGGHQKIVINKRYRNEDFRLFVCLVPHEILHHDLTNGSAEQAVDSAITSMLQMQVLSADAKVAYLGTELTRRLNTETLAFIDSRNPGSPNSQIVAPQGKGVYPGGAIHAPRLLESARRLNRH